MTEVGAACTTGLATVFGFIVCRIYMYPTLLVVLPAPSGKATQNTAQSGN